MPISLEEKRAIYASCRRFLTYHYPRTVADQMREIAESPIAKTAKDEYGRGDFINSFEAEVAALLGKEAAVFMPSGTMAQQIALRIWCDRAARKTIGFHPTCHLEIHEQNAYAELHHLSAHLLGAKDQLFTLEEQKAAPAMGALLIELPQREIGGQLPPWKELIAICDYAKSQGTYLHMDGARLWECKPFYGKSYAEISAPFDSVYVSCYKILGGMPGAVLAGPSDFIDEAKIWQRRHGGNLVQMTPNAISAKIGMEKHLPKIPDYVAKAAELANEFRKIEGVRVVPEHPPTNLMHLWVRGNRDALVDAAWEYAREHHEVLFWGFGETDDPGVCKVELTIGEASLDWTGKQARVAVESILALDVQKD